MIEMIVFIFGLIVGSFINVLIFRLPHGEDVIKNRSHCPNCAKILSWYELIPVVSFLLQKGRCRKCGAKISFQYIIIELLTGILFLMIFIKLSASLTPDNLTIFQFNNFIINTIYYILYTIYHFYIISALIAIAAIDLKTFLIPDKLVIPAIIIALIFQFLNPLTSNISNTLNISNILFALLIFLFFSALYFFSKGKAMGFGDAKLGLLIGLFLPFPLNIFAIMLSFVFGGIFGIILLALKKAGRKTQIPFGPFMVLSALITFLFPEIVSLMFPIFH